MSEFTENIWTHSTVFMDAAKRDADTLREVAFVLSYSYTQHNPVEYTIEDGAAAGSKEISMNYGGASNCVLTVLNYYLFPVTAMLDSIKLSQQGKLDDALDVRPFMFSGPAPTMVIWSGTDRESVPVLGYPELTNEDAEQAFRYWLRYIFGVSLSDDGKLG